MEGLAGALMLVGFVMLFVMPETFVVGIGLMSCGFACVALDNHGRDKGR